MGILKMDDAATVGLQQGLCHRQDEPAHLQGREPFVPISTVQLMKSQHICA